MLCMMHVRNFAIIEEIEVEFAAGMNVLTGETGAGKSILVDALGLLLGERASADVIREGQDRAEIAAIFEPTTEAKAWLEERAMEAGDECHLRRVISRDGRARGFINGNPATMQSLRELGAMLVNIHGQHEHQALTQSDVQRRLLDARGDYADKLAKTATAWQRWRAARDARLSLESESSDQADRIEFLQFQLAELDSVAAQPGEFEALESERLRLASATDIAERGERALAALSEGEPDNAVALLATATREIEALADLGGEISEALVLLNEAQTSLGEAATTLHRFVASTEHDPNRLTEVERRSDSVRALARKHRVAPEQVHAQAEALRAELERMENADSALEQQIEAEQTTRADLDKLLKPLSRARRKAANAFSDQVSDDMHALGMQGGKFVVTIETDEAAEPQIHGQDRVRFDVSANPGQAPQSLAKVASGGELSRISLAIQVAAGQRKGVASMVFDEVDSGVGGGVAEVVGSKMRDLADSCQVLAVTHLPQVAGQAHHHLRVSKMTDGKTTKTKIVPLSSDERVEEIARMLGGVEITGTTRKHAREMLRMATSRAKRS
ncbi:MAG: DNA repair protein RecN [Pseudomonadota bacterium]